MNHFELMTSCCNGKLGLQNICADVNTLVWLLTPSIDHHVTYTPTVRISFEVLFNTCIAMKFMDDDDDDDIICEQSMEDRILKCSL